MNITRDELIRAMKCYNKIGDKRTTVEPWQVKQARAEGKQDGFEDGRCYERQLISENRFLAVLAGVGIGLAADFIWQAIVH